MRRDATVRWSRRGKWMSNRRIRQRSVALDGLFRKFYPHKSTSDADAIHWAIFSPFSLSWLHFISSYHLISSSFFFSPPSSSSASIFISQPVLCYSNLLEARKGTLRKKARESTSSSSSDDVLSFVCSSHFFLHSVDRSMIGEEKCLCMWHALSCWLFVVSSTSVRWRDSKCVEAYACTNDAYVAVNREEKNERTNERANEHVSKNSYTEISHCIIHSLFADRKHLVRFLSLHFVK